MEAAAEASLQELNEKTLNGSRNQIIACRPYFLHNIFIHFIFSILVQEISNTLIWKISEALPIHNFVNKGFWLTCSPWFVTFDSQAPKRAKTAL